MYYIPNIKNILIIYEAATSENNNYSTIVPRHSRVNNMHVYINMYTYVYVNMLGRYIVL